MYSFEKAGYQVSRVSWLNRSFSDVLFFVMRDGKLNIFVFQIAGWMKKAIWGFHLGLSEIITGIFHDFLPFYDKKRGNNERKSIVVAVVFVT